MKKLLTSLPLLSLAVLNANLIEKHNDTLLVSTGTELKSVDIQNKLQPLEKYSLKIGEYVEDVDISGDYLYVITKRGMSIYSLSDKDNPTLIGKFDTEYAKKVSVRDNRAYIANYRDGLQIVDISVKSNYFMSSHKVRPPQCVTCCGIICILNE